ncbi:uncharacterized protein LOC134248417, partial [Saccostrea cucullata]|uniref:uncharacterized protein LOC134248417 n=1 Tax=Saccostrea cuccullata TaxID=36930 RepID=UPI002ED30790
MSTNKSPSLFKAIFIFLIMQAFGIVSRSKGYPAYSYDFNMFPVPECPMNSSTFQRAAIRMNCTTDTRYLCSPDNQLQSLIEFCTNRKRKLYGPDSCVRLEGRGDLNHVKCVKTFSEGCPNTSFYDEQIYKFPACLHINTAYKCFKADKNCSSIHLNGSQEKKMTAGDWKLAIILGVLLPSIILFIFLISLLYWRKVKTKKENKDINLGELRQLKQFLAKKYVKVNHARCIIVGCTKAGKTTLLKRLQDKPFKDVKNVEETQGVDVHANSFE